jgi:hypothetical protein
MTFMSPENMLQTKSPFLGYESTKKLQMLAAEAIDLSKENVLTPERVAAFYG